MTSSESTRNVIEAADIDADTVVKVLFSFPSLIWNIFLFHFIYTVASVSILFVVYALDFVSWRLFRSTYFRSYH